MPRRNGLATLKLVARVYGRRHFSSLSKEFYSSHRLSYQKSARMRYFLHHKINFAEPILGKKSK